MRLHLLEPLQPSEAHKVMQEGERCANEEETVHQMTTEGLRSE